MRRSNYALAGAAAAAGFGAWELWRAAKKDALSKKLPNGTRVVILGAGFGGASAAKELAALMSRPEHGTITLVDERGALLFTPMLTEVAGGELDARHVVAPIVKLPARITFERAKIVATDLKRRTVTIKAGDAQANVPENEQTLQADHLVFALGSVTNFHHTPGVEEHSLTIKDISEAVAIRNRALDLLQRASHEANAELRREMLTFVVAGGGYTGVETMAAVNDLLRNEAARYARIQPSDVRTLLIETTERLMPETTPELAAYARRKLEQRGVEVLLRTKITGADESYVELEGGRRIPARTLIWAGGVKPNPLVDALDCAKGKHGGIAVDQCCAVPGHPGVWAIGDCAEIPKPVNHEQTYAPTAQDATREGKHVARNIVRSLTGDPLQPFRYKPIGELALVGRHAGVARVYGMEFSGVPAWVLWRAVYLLKMPVMSQRFRIGLDWLLDLAFGRNLVDVPY